MPGNEPSFKSPPLACSPCDGSVRSQCCAACEGRAVWVCSIMQGVRLLQAGFTALGVEGVRNGAECCMGPLLSPLSYQRAGGDAVPNWGLPGPPARFPACWEPPSRSCCLLGHIPELVSPVELGVLWSSDDTTKASSVKVCVSFA